MIVHVSCSKYIVQIIPVVVYTCISVIVCVQEEERQVKRGERQKQERERQLQREAEERERQLQREAEERERLANRETDDTPETVSDY